MKRLLLILLTIAVCSQMKAIPAEGTTAKVKQPDGTELTIRLVGDEFLHFNVTEDGYSIVRNDEGFYVYAQQNAEGELIPSNQIAHDEPMRQSKERAFLAATRKYLKPKMTEQAVKVKNEEYTLRRKASQKHRAPVYDYTKFRGLVVLVEFNDCEFDQENYTEVVTDLIKKENFTGYYNYNNRRVPCTGSVVDYFRDNSMGVFTPQFDIVGPVKIDRSKYYSNGTKRTVTMTVDACNAIDANVNFADYDGDKDGNVDMIYFIFAGHGSHVTGNDSRLVWPHAYYIYNPSTGYKIRKDGVYLNRYACSTELQGRETGRDIDGIGTICHEFSHVLGLPDFYDTDYAEGGGQSVHPANWTLMAGGGYLNNSRTPAGYSLFERYMAGWATPQVIEEEGEYSLERVNESNTGFRINTPVNKEFFILENRQNTRWDTYLPGHGLLVFRVDSTNTSVWSQNNVNDNPAHNYYVLVRARGNNGSAAADPYPGTGRVTTLNNVTTPANLKTWAGKETKFGLINITERNGVISFGIENTYVLRELILPETYALPTGITQQLTVKAVPEYVSYTLTWKSADESIVTVDQEGNIHGVSEGTTTITVESNNGVTASCEVTVATLPETNQIAAFKAFDEGQESILSLENAEVLYVYQNDIYVRDATGAIVLNKTGLSLKQNDIVSGKLIGKLQHLNNMPQFSPTKPASDLTVAEGSEVQPTALKATDLSPRYYADYVVVEKTPLLRDKNIFVLDDDENRIARLYNVLGVKGITVPSDLTDKRFNIYAIYGTHPTGSEIIEELYILRSPEETDWTPSGIELNEETTPNDQNVYDLQGRKILSTKLPKGIYIVGGRKVVVK
ncbi:MAG: M6 family metalloprotease domain-containing protein [Prevotella sp.]|nr:M6 family metalloprotease domain-containing protein [Prevotella sp.]